MHQLPASSGCCRTDRCRSGWSPTSVARHRGGAEPPPGEVRRRRQARILLGDLRAYQAQLCREVGHDVDERTAARLWVIEVLTPYEQLAHEAVHHAGTPIQAYCDLLEVRWLLSEKDAHDVGTNRALAALARDVIPNDSAAKMAVAEIPTAPFAVLQSDDDS